jgi:hypothetical protein
MGLGSGILKKLFRIRNPGVKKTPDPRSQIPELASKKRFLLFKSLTIETIHTPPLSSHFSTFKSIEQMFKTADEDVLSAKKYLWLRGVFNFRYLTPWRHNNKALYSIDKNLGPTFHLFLHPSRGR